MGSEEREMEPKEIVSVLKRKLSNYVGFSNSAETRHEVKNHVNLAIREISRIVGLRIPRVYLIQRHVARGFMVVLSSCPESVDQWKQFGFSVLPELDQKCSRCKHPLVGTGSGSRCLNCWSPKITNEVKAILGEI